MNKFNIGDMKDKMLEICDEILDEKWDSSCDISCGEIRCENCFFGDTFEVCDNRDTAMFKFLAKCYKDKHSNIIKESNKMEKTFKGWEIMKMISEKQIENKTNLIDNEGSYYTVIDGYLLDGKHDRFNYTYETTSSLILDRTFSIVRKEYTFEEAFKTYEEGKEIESCETGARFIKSDNKDMLYDPTIGFTPFGRSFNIDEIRAKWYVNNK